MSNTDAKRSKVPPEHKKEADTLKALWEASTTRRSQARFGQDYDLGNQSNVGHYLAGRISLNARAAAAFAKELNCRVEDFSPRLAAQIAGMVAAPAAPAAEASVLPAAAPPNLAQALDSLALVLKGATVLQRQTAADLLAGFATKPETAKFVAKALAAVLEPGKQG